MWIWLQGGFQKPGQMRLNMENLEISSNFEKINEYHGKMIQNLEKLGGN